jgi:vacuolar-type H+-ATPase subunit I/STV1
VEILLHHDKTLHAHITTVLGCCPGLIGWGMMSTLFTEILTKAQWFKIMDFIFAFHDQIRVTMLLPVALMREVRLQVLGLGPEHARSFHHYFHQNLVVDLDKVVDMVKIMAASTSKTKFSSDSSTDLSAEEEMDKLGGTAVLTDIDKLKRNMALDRGGAIFPLPKGRYPLHDGYPLMQKDGEANERNKMLEFTNVLSERRGVVEALEEQLNEFGDDHLDWLMRQKERVAAEGSLREHSAKVERDHMRELLRIEEQISERRIEAMRQMEEYALRERVIMEEMQRDKLSVSDEKNELQQQKREFEVNVARLRAIANEAERRAQEKLQVVYHSRGLVDERYANQHVDDMRASQQAPSETERLRQAEALIQKLKATVMKKEEISSDSSS